MLLAAMTFDLTETGLRLELSEDHGKFEEFCNELAEVLWRFDGLQRVISSVHGKFKPSYTIPNLTSSSGDRH